ncbi:MAG TPA: disulfide bond formation protein B, partial [Candidatus Accumulibacter sp.]|nr:disulfide bond formation protein B [Accumulibacter sp.]
IERIVDWFGTLWPQMFLATGFCSSKDWVLLGLSMANWSVLCFIAFLVAAMVLSRRGG